MSDTEIIQFYKGIFQDPGVDREEAAELTEFLQKLNPPPDKLIKLRATAFKVACDYLSEDDHDLNISLLRTINYIVHAIEQNCMQVKEDIDYVDVDEETLRDFYKTLFDGLTVDSEEHEQLKEFFVENPPSNLIQARATAFKTGCDFLADDHDKTQNIQLLRCINVIIHVLEMTFYKPKAYKLQEPDDLDLSGMTLQDAIQHLWELDVNRLTPGDDYVINVQRGKKPFWKEDSARDPLFTSVDRDVWNRPTYASFVKLLDNYVAETGTKETVSNAERAENREFLQNIMETAPMQFCHQYCHAQGNKVPADRAGFMSKLQNIWFDMYRREGTFDSSGFEHVFIGEVKNGDVSGFHNWIQFYLEEKRGNLDYRGYIKPRARGTAQHDADDYLLTFQFAWKGVEKFVGTSFVGVSPEFEMALYTMCFLLGEQETHIELNTGTDTFGVNIKCYSMARGKIGTTFPEVTSHYEE